MPNFELVPRAEAEVKSTTGKRAEILREYLVYIEELKNGQAGRLEASEGETVGAVRRRLGAAARQVGKDLIIRRVGEQVYFWAKPERGASSKRRGRPRTT